MIGIIATVLLTVAYTPQLITIIKTNKTEGLSLKTYLILIIGLIFWCIHAFTHKDWALLTSSLVSLIQSIIIIIILYLKNDKRN